jgi:hypothetical protein
LQAAHVGNSTALELEGDGDPATEIRSRHAYLLA